MAHFQGLTRVGLGRREIHGARSLLGERTGAADHPVHHARDASNAEGQADIGVDGARHRGRDVRRGQASRRGIDRLIDVIRADEMSRLYEDGKP